MLRIDDVSNRETLLTESLPMSDRLIQFTLTGNSLCVIIRHLLCDGGGFKQLLYLLCSAYNGLPEPDAGHLMRRGFAQLLDEHTNRAAITLKMLLSVLGSYKSKPVYAQANCEAPYVLERIVPQALLANIHSRA